MVRRERTTTDIARRVGCDRTTVTRRARELGLGRETVTGWLFSAAEARRLAKSIRPGPGRPRTRRASTAD